MGVFSRHGERPNMILGAFSNLHAGQALRLKKKKKMTAHYFTEIHWRLRCKRPFVLLQSITCRHTGAVINGAVYDELTIAFVRRSSTNMFASAGPACKADAWTQ